MELNKTLRREDDVVLNNIPAINCPNHPFANTSNVSPKPEHLL